MSDMMAHRRAQLAASPAVLRGAFRPFFLLGAIWAIAVLVLFGEALAGAIALPSAFDAIAWHRHEMLFGYQGAVIVGFLLTAAPNWTGRMPIAGAPLALLAGLWLGARAAVLFSGWIGVIPGAVLDVSFLTAGALVAGREVLAGRDRNMPVVGLSAVLAVASALDHCEMLGVGVPAGLGWRLAIGAIIVMLSLIGGRIAPSFTRNWLAGQGITRGLPGEPTWFDLAALWLTGFAMIAWTIRPDAAASAALLVLAGLGQGLRLARWSGTRTVRAPIVFILHVAYGWISLGLVLLGLSRFVDGYPSSAALHALTAGAMAGMTIAVMTRATRGHSGRPLNADGLTVAAYVLVTLAAALRVAAPVLAIDYMLAIHLAALAWIGAFLLFLLRYAPMLIGPRPDGKL